MTTKTESNSIRTEAKGSFSAEISPGISVTVTIDDKILKSAQKKRSRQKSRSKRKYCRSRKHGTPRYRNRKSPPIPAKQCPDKRHEGNDGRMYISEKRGKSKNYRWYKK